MSVRPGRTGDIRAMAAILAANEKPIDWPDRPELGWPYLDHLVARTRTNVAQVDGELVVAVVAVGWARRERKRRTDGGWTTRRWPRMAPVPGPHPVVAPLLERGARIRGRDQYGATDPSLADPVRLFPNQGFL